MTRHAGRPSDVPGPPPRWPARPRRGAVVALALLACGAADLAAAGRIPPLTTPELLVDLARDYGLSRGGRQTPADVRHIRALLRAAVRLNPQLAEGYGWLYELATLGGDERAAADVLERLVAADPGSEAAAARWLELGVSLRQTEEERQQWLSARLAGFSSPTLRAIVHAHLARVALQRLDLSTARRELDSAFRLHPDCPDAALLAVSLLDTGSNDEERLRTYLRLLRLNPLDPDSAWQVGAVLETCGFVDEAGAFYAHAQRLEVGPPPGRPLPPEKVFIVARNDAARGRINEVANTVRGMMNDQTIFAELAIFGHWLFGKYDRKLLAESVANRLRAEFALIKDPAQVQPRLVGLAAWFYCTIDVQPQRALALAEDLVRRQPNESFSARVLGWAQAINLRTDDARRTLAPIADRDPYACYLLAKLQRDAGEEAAAAHTLSRLVYWPRSGPAADYLAELAPLAPATQPAVERFPQVAAALAEFDPTVLSFDQFASRYVQVQIELDDASLAPGEPWWATISLTNTAPFPITLGPDWMVNPIVVLSFHVEGDRTLDFPDLLPILIDRTRVLAPGATVKVRRTLDVGPLRRIARFSPQQLQSVTVQALLDPQPAPEGGWKPGPAGQRVRAVHFNRVPAQTSAADWGALFAAMTGDSDVARVRAIEVMSELLGEQQRAALGKLNYTPDPAPSDRIEQALLTGLRSDSWELRARTLDSLQSCGLSAPLVQAAEACLNHPHFLVRMLAIRLLARQGSAFRQRAEAIRAADEDELVRELALSVLEQLDAGAAAPPAPQPASQAAETDALTPLSP